MLEHFVSEGLMNCVCLTLFFHDTHELSRYRPIPTCNVMLYEPAVNFIVNYRSSRKYRLCRQPT